jgi:hypothetical protein
MTSTEEAIAARELRTQQRVKDDIAAKAKAEADEAAAQAKAAKPPQATAVQEAGIAASVKAEAADKAAGKPAADATAASVAVEDSGGET